jgi:hypothetical protein
MEIVCDGYGGNFALARAPDEAGLRMRTVHDPERAAACAKPVDLRACQSSSSHA